MASHGRRFARAVLACALLGCSSPPPPDRILEDFRGGSNDHHWRLHQSGTCGRGTTPPTAPAGWPPTVEGLLSGLLGGESFRSGRLTLTAVTGPKKAPPPRDECGVLLATALASGEGRAYNGGDLDGDFEAEIGFRLVTPQSVLTVNFVFDGESKYIALMIPVSGWRAVRAIAPGRIGFMVPGGDLEMANAPIERGAPTALKIVYSRRRGAAEVFLNGRAVDIAGETLIPAPKPPFPKRFQSPASLLYIYTEAQLMPEIRSTVWIDAVRLRAGRRSLLQEAALWLGDWRWHARRSEAAARRFWREEWESAFAIAQHLRGR